MLGDIIIRLECLGQFEKPIFIHKFRSMYPNAHEDFLKVFESNGFDNLGKIINDPRITPLGKIIRKYFIDEIPQFYDLSRGVLSLVGLRARSEERWTTYPKEHMERALQYKPGLFGIQYYYTNARDFQDRINEEKEYLDRIEKDGKYQTDKKYLLTILDNIIFGKIRSR